MTLNFAELTQKIRTGKTASEEDLVAVLNAGPAATFALVEFAAEFRRSYFQNSLEVSNLVGEGGRETSPLPAKDSGFLQVGNNETPVELAHATYALAHKNSLSRISVNFLLPTGGEESSADLLTPMYCLRVLVAARLAAPEKSLGIASGRVEHLRSLQSLALHLIDFTYISDHRELGPQAIFEDLKNIDGAGLTILGAEYRNLTEDYIAYLSNQGISDAASYARAVFTTNKTGGCGTGVGACAGCGCGTGECGSTEKTQQVGRVADHGL